MYLFSGPRRAKVDMLDIGREMGMEVTTYDICLNPAHNLMDDHFFEKILHGIRSGLYDAGIACPPCATFRGDYDDGGKRQVRGR